MISNYNDNIKQVKENKGKYTNENEIWSLQN